MFYGVPKTKRVPHLDAEISVEDFFLAPLVLLAILLEILEIAAL